MRNIQIIFWIFLKIKHPTFRFAIFVVNILLSWKGRLINSETPLKLTRSNIKYIYYKYKFNIQFNRFLNIYNTARPKSEIYYLYCSLFKRFGSDLPLLCWYLGFPLTPAWLPSHVSLLQVTNNLTKEHKRSNSQVIFSQRTKIQIISWIQYSGKKICIITILSVMITSIFFVFFCNQMQWLLIIKVEKVRDF